MKRKQRRTCRMPALFLLPMLLLAGPADAAKLPDHKPLSAKRSAKIERKWGIEIVGVRRAAADTMIDFRYRIVDQDKAGVFVDRTVKAYLVDQASGRTVTVPTTAKLGPLRQTVRYGKPPEGRVMFMLFSNPGREIKSGSRVTIVIGDFKAKNLIVD